MRHVPPAVRPPHDFQDEIVERIGRVGFTVAKLHRHYPPYDTDEQGRALFLGRPSRAHDGDCKLTAWLPQASDRRVLISGGWR